MLASTANAVPRDPTNDEVALLVLANEARAAAGLKPMVWHKGLGEVALQHSTDMADNDCYQHNSCNGTYWSTRISKKYPSYFALGENINTGGSDAESNHNGWMNSPGHRSNILGPFTEFGAGIALGETNFGMWAFATEDFGDRGAVDYKSQPAIIAGSVISNLNANPYQSKNFMFNYFHDGGAKPQKLQALAGNACITSFTKTAGTNSSATYMAKNQVFSGNGCIPVVFEAVRSDGQYFRYPATGSILVGIGTATGTCARFSTQLPTASCAITPGEPGDPQDPTPAPNSQTLVPTASIKSTTRAKQTVELLVTAKENNAAIQGVKAVFKITGNNGISITRTVTTNKSGIAKFSRAFNRKGQAGTYEVLVTGTYQVKENGTKVTKPFAQGAATQFKIDAYK